MSAGSVILSALRNRVARSGTVFEGRPVDIFVNSAGVDAIPEGLAPAQLWRTQPHLRTVVDFLARNVAQLGLHSFVMDGEDRVRDRDSAVARVLCSRPNAHMTTYELVYDLVGNLALYNRAYWFVYPGKDGGLQIQPFPSDWVAVEYDSFFSVKSYSVSAPGAKEPLTVPAENVVAFNGWNPVWDAEGSPVETLRLILEEQHHSRVHRLQVWKRNGRVGSYLTRPQGAPDWDNTARKRFYEMFEAFVGDNGERAGGTPLLEDGMELKRVGFNSADEQWSDSVKISLETVAQVYQVNPTMVGVLDNANYSNTKEFNKTLYTNTLGPMLRMIESRINAFLLPLFGAQDGQFVEFNVEEKLRGSFEEQAAVTSQAVGGPWMTRNEARKMRNLPPIDSGDELIVPLNLGVPGEPTATDDDPSIESESSKAFDIVRNHLDRLNRVIPSKGYDRARFEKELADDFVSAGFDTGGAVKAHTVIENLLNEGVGFEPSAFFDAYRKAENAD